MVLYVQIESQERLFMHIFDYSFLKDDLLPAQLVTLAANISTLKVMTAVRRRCGHQQTSAHSLRHSRLSLRASVQGRQRTLESAVDFATPLPERF